MNTMPRSFFLGVDTGGSKTHALVSDSSGNALGFGMAGPGNHEMVGYEGLRKALREAVTGALATAGLSVGQISGAGFGIAGYDWPSELPDTLAAIGVLGLTCPVEVVNDCVLGLLAGASQGWGVVIDAGSGTNCRGLDQHGREGRITGNGTAFGEFGGGGDLVYAAVRAVSHAWSQRGPSTMLTRLLLERTGAASVGDLLEGLSQFRYTLEAGDASLVILASEQGDPVAREIIAWNGRELGESVNAVIRQLHLQAQAFAVVMIGSLFNAGAILINPMVETVHSLAPGASFVHLQAPPVVGGVLLAMQRHGIDTRAIRQVLIDSTRRLFPGDNPGANHY